MTSYCGPMNDGASTLEPGTIDGWISDEQSCNRGRLPQNKGKWNVPRVQLFLPKNGSTWYRSRKIHEERTSSPRASLRRADRKLAVVLFRNTPSPEIYTVFNTTTSTNARANLAVHFMWLRENFSTSTSPLRESQVAPSQLKLPTRDGCAAQDSTPPHLAQGRRKTSSAGPLHSCNSPLFPSRADNKETVVGGVISQHGYNLSDHLIDSASHRASWRLPRNLPALTLATFPPPSPCLTVSHAGINSCTARLTSSC